MDLVDAFHAIAPKGGRDPAVDRQRQRAAVVLYLALTELARKVRATDDQRQDLVAEALLTLTRSGPRPVPQPPPPEGRVRTYLFITLQNKHIDHVRHESRVVVSADIEECPSEGPVDADEEPEASDATLQLLASDLTTLVLPSLRRDAAGNLRLAVAEMLDIRLRRRTFAALATAESGGVDAIHQRHCRARQRLLTCIRDKEKAGALPRATIARYRALVEQLRSRAGPDTVHRPSVTGIGGAHA